MINISHNHFYMDTSSLSGNSNMCFDKVLHPQWSHWLGRFSLLLLNKCCWKAFGSNIHTQCGHCIFSCFPWTLLLWFDISFFVFLFLATEASDMLKSYFLDIRFNLFILFSFLYESIHFLMLQVAFAVADQLPFSVKSVTFWYKFESPPKIITISTLFLS